MQTRSQTREMTRLSIERVLSRRKRAINEYLMKRMERCKRREINRKRRILSDSNCEEPNDDETDTIFIEKLQDLRQTARQELLHNKEFMDELHDHLDIFSRKDYRLHSREEKCKTILSIFRLLNDGLRDHICYIMKHPNNVKDIELLFKTILVIYNKIDELDEELCSKDGNLEIEIRWEMRKTKKMIVPIIMHVMDEDSFTQESYLEMFQMIRVSLMP